MKALKPFFFLMLLLGVFTLSARAQPTNSPKGRNITIHTARALYVKLDQELNFTPEQKDRVYNVLIARSEAWQKHVKGAPKAKKEEQITKINKKAVDDLSAILTKEQIAKHAQLRQKSEKSRDKSPQDQKKSSPMYDEAEMDF
jgi:hypothetical protein